jgi:EAL domain-containing protein (putative c-di-GMP-specific phosphodiesterase class I)/CHASE2 domain-containing sensor protein
MQPSYLAIFNRLLARRRCIVFAMAAAFGFLTYASGVGAPLDQQLRSARDGIRLHPASGQIGIVEIDARSLAKIGSWPSPRSVHAKAIRRLTAAGARSIAFDVDFSATSTPAEDAALAAALDNAGHSIILPTFDQRASSTSSDFVENLPAKPFEGKAFLGAVNIIPDPDSYVRQMLLGVATKGVPRPSLPAMLAEKSAEIGRSFDIDYSINPDTIPRYSYVDLLEGKIPASQLAGKRFLIGATAIEMGDRYSVPRYGVLSGVVIQALAAETLLEGPIPRSWSGLPALLLALLLLGFVSRGGSRPKRIAAFAAGSTAIALLPLATEALFALSFPIAPALVTLFTATLGAGITFFGERYQQRALRDRDTNLPNLAALELGTAGQSRPGGIVVARIDRFAAIASGLGSAATANLVLRVADRLSFINSGCAIYRIDEASLAWVEEKANEASMDDRLQSIAAIMRSPVDCGRMVDVKLTLGIASESGAPTKQLVADASLAAVHAAQRGGLWERFAGAESDETNWHLSLLGELEAAMSAGQVWNAYQPKLDLRTGRIIGAEALVRWQHPQRGSIAPDGFIPLVEEHGRARDLTAHVLSHALEDALLWDAAGYPIGVAVNVSATLLADHEFIETVGLTLQSSALAAGRVTIEITESAAMNSPERAIAALESWRALGVNISIDDYGTGQSSLGYLQKLPATELKIDKSFVQTIGSDHRNAIMVRSTIALAHELGMKVVAEGIEDEGCLQLLTEMGCDTGQGYHISRPVAADVLTGFLSRQTCEAA